MDNKMSEHGAALQTYNQELVKCLEDLKIKRKELLDSIKKDENQKKHLEKNINSLQDELNVIVNNLQKRRALYNNYERIIKDAELGFKKILESSQELLNLTKQEADKIDNCSRNQNNLNKNWRQRP